MTCPFRLVKSSGNRTRLTFKLPIWQALRVKPHSHPRPDAAKQLRAWIDRSNMKDSAAASLFGVSLSYLSHLLAGDRTPGLAVAGTIEALTGVPMRGWLARSLGAKESRPKKANEKLRKTA